ncbi:MAG: ATP synthase F1 subunit gamma [Chitinophagales bacterium]|nr:ATP synthase F1 subunit gamma [Chitinophagales bacterium]MCZ2392822.1 ATP synthase F1 subunit gamma [Chitinophagales bacterium]
MAANLKEVRGRITSVKSTMQITKAMKMVSASKLRRATDRIVQIRPYANQLNSVLANIVSNLQGDYNLDLAQERELKKVLIVVVTSDKGLCGGFNANVLKLVKSLIKEKYAELENKGKIELLFIGKKGIDAFRTSRIESNLSYVNTLGKLDFENSSMVAQDIITLFKNGVYDRVEVVYNMFKNAAVQIPTVEQYLPVQTQVQNENSISADYIFEPGKEEILDTLIPNILKTQFFRFLLDSVASEHGARMTAMDKATDNANELLKDLSIMYNRARQAAITTELSEIVSGAAALSAE